MVCQQNIFKCFKNRNGSNHTKKTNYRLQSGNKTEWETTLWMGNNLILSWYKDWQQT